jgi:hypothetical protein
MQKGERFPFSSGSMSAKSTADSAHMNFSNTALSTQKRKSIMRSLIFLRFEGRGRLYSRHMMPYHSLHSIVA